MLRALLFLWAVIVVFGVAHAQAPPGPATPLAENATPAVQRSSECAPIKPVRHHGLHASEGMTVGRTSEAIGDRLARFGGILCPPSDVDPAMRAVAPETGDKPEIRPPGSGTPGTESK